MNGRNQTNRLRPGCFQRPVTREPDHSVIPIVVQQRFAESPVSINALHQLCRHLGSPIQPNSPTMTPKLLKTHINNNNAGKTGASTQKIAGETKLNKIPAPMQRSNDEISCDGP